MSLHQAKNNLEKIVFLFKNIEADGAMSNIERDLMLSYIRQLYDTILSEKGSSSNGSTANVAPTVIAATPAEVPVLVETPKLVPTPVVVEKIVERTVENVVEEVKKVETIELIVEKPKPVETPREIPTNTVFPEPPKPKAAQKPLIKPAYERVDQSELFEEKMKKELSDKLGEMPIEDIKKGMSLNERIIFLNDLFDSNQQEFESAINNLNSVGDFDAAKTILAQLANRFDWASKEKQAKPFIKLVRRRHNT